MSVSDSIVPLGKSIEISHVSFGEAFATLPLELIDKIFNELLTNKKTMSLFSCVQALNKTFKWLTGWERNVGGIAKEMPFDRVHFIRAIRTGQGQIVQKLIEYSDTPRPLDSINRSGFPKEEDFTAASQAVDKDNNIHPLTAAIEGGQTEIFKELWSNKELGSNEQIKIPADQECLELAIKQGQLEIFEFLLEQGDSIDFDRSLKAAIEGGQTEIFKKLWPKQTIRKQVQVICIELAIKQERSEIFKFLLENVGSDITDERIYIEQFLKLAITSKNLENVKTLCSKKSFILNYSIVYCAALLQIVREFNLQEKEQMLPLIKYFIDNKDKLDTRVLQPFSNTGMNNPLVIAIGKDAELSRLLWDSSLFNLTTEIFNEACKYGRVELVKKCLAQPDFQVKDPSRSFHYAAMKGGQESIEITKMLLKSSKVLIDPFVRSTVNVAMTAVGVLVVSPISGIFGLIAGLIESLLSLKVYTLLGLAMGGLKVCAVGMAAAVISGIAIGILWELGAILNHAYMLGRPAAYLACHHIKILVSGKKSSQI